MAHVGKIKVPVEICFCDRERWQAMNALLSEQARAIPLGDRSEDSYNTAIRMVREVARRFPVSDYEGDTNG